MRGSAVQPPFPGPHVRGLRTIDLGCAATKGGPSRRLEQMDVSLRVLGPPLSSQMKQKIRRGIKHPKDRYLQLKTRHQHTARNHARKVDKTHKNVFACGDCPNDTPTRSYSSISVLPITGLVRCHLRISLQMCLPHLVLFNEKQRAPEVFVRAPIECSWQHRPNIGNSLV